MDGERTDSLTGQAVILTVGQLIVYAGNLIIGVILVRMISVADYGTFMQVNMVFSMTVSIMIFGLPAALFYFIPQLQPHEVKRFVLQHLLMLLVIGALAAGILYVCIPYLARFMNNTQLEQLVVYILLLLVLGIMNEAIEPTLISIKKADMVAWLNIAFVCGHLLLIPLLLWIGYGLEGVLAAMASLQGLKLLVVCRQLLCLPGGTHPLLCLGEIIAQLKYSYPVGSARVLSIVRPRVDQFMISYWYSPAAFAVYARGAFDLPVTTLVVGNVSNVMLPKLVELRKKGRIEDIFMIWQEAMKKVSLITLPLFVYFFVYAKEFFVVFFTETYLNSVPIFLIYLCTIPFEVFYFSHLHLAFGKPRHILIANLWTLPLTVILTFAFYSLFGFIGPALASAITKILIIVYHLWIIAKYFSVSMFRIFPWLYQGQILGLCLVAGMLVYPLKWIPAPTFAILCLSAIMFSFLYLWLLERCGFISSEIKKLIRDHFPIDTFEKLLLKLRNV